METPDLPLLILQRNTKEYIISLEPSLNLNIIVEFPEDLQGACQLFDAPKSKTRYK